LVFGRFPSNHATQSLPDFLADGFPILDALSRITERPQIVVEDVKANWKLNLHITLEEYHGVAVHRSTLGQAGTLADPMGITYRKLGLHSCYLGTADPKAFDRMVEGCRDGSYGASHYFIAQIFPNLIVSLSCADGENWYCYIQQFTPLSFNHSRYRAWIYPSPLVSFRPWYAAAMRFFTNRIRKRLVLRAFKRVAGEDRAVCERLQEVAPQIRSVPFLGALERRIGWFEKTYQRLMNAESKILRREYSNASTTVVGNEQGSKGSAVAPTVGVEAG
jgi:phenylpropionate dioxygenase-like ring-hydroxylating dioxygenase large terminal subunit